VQALEAEQAEQAQPKRERPTASPRPVVVSADAFPTLDLDRQHTVVDALLEAMVVAKAARRGAPWMPDLLEFV